MNAEQMRHNLTGNESAEQVCNIMFGTSVVTPTQSHYILRAISTAGNISDTCYLSTTLADKIRTAAGKQH